MQGEQIYSLFERGGDIECPLIRYHAHGTRARDFVRSMVEPRGPCWEKFSLRVPDADFVRIPALLEEREAAAVEMGLLARAQWEEWFSERACFHRVIEWCLDIKRRRRFPENWARFFPYIQYLRPFHFRHLLRTKYRAWQGRKR